MQRQLASSLRTHVRRAAGEDRVVKTNEREKLKGLAREAADALGRGQHTADEIVDKAMSDAMAAWAAINPPGTPSGKYLSKREIAELKRANPVLGEATEAAAAIVRRRRTSSANKIEVSVRAPVPGVRLETRGDRYTVHATAEVPARTPISMTIAGTEYHLIRMPRGINSIDVNAPAGYGLEHVDSKNGTGDVSITFRIVRDVAGALTQTQALAKARAAALDYLKNERMSEPGWSSELPQTWDEAVARGALTSGAAFADPANPDSEVFDKPDRWVFTGRGPLNLYTEIEIAKKDGEVLRKMIEAD